MQDIRNIVVLTGAGMSGEKSRIPSFRGQRWTLGRIPRREKWLSDTVGLNGCKRPHPDARARSPSDSGVTGSFEEAPDHRSP